MLLSCVEGYTAGLVIVRPCGHRAAPWSSCAQAQDPRMPTMDSATSRRMTGVAARGMTGVALRGMAGAAASCVLIPSASTSSGKHALVVGLEEECHGHGSAEPIRFRCRGSRRFRAAPVRAAFDGQAPIAARSSDGATPSAAAIPKSVFMRGLEIGPASRVEPRPASINCTWFFVMPARCASASWERWVARRSVRICSPKARAVSMSHATS